MMKLSFLWERVKNVAKKVASAMWIGLLALSGVGLIYLAAKTKIIKDGYRGVSYDRGKLKILKPGIHCLYSPFHNLESTIPYKMDEVVSLSFQIKSRDSWPTLVDADFSYTIEDPEKAILAVKNYREELKESVKGAISSILQEHNYEDLTTGQISRLSQIPTAANLHEMDDEEKEDKYPGSRGPSPSPTSNFKFSKPTIFDHIKNSLNAVCKKWGIQISRVRIINIDTPDKNGSNAIAEANVEKIRAQRDAENIRIIYNAKIQAAKDVAQNLHTPEERRIYELHTKVDEVRAWSSHNGSLGFFGSSGAPNPAQLFAPQAVAPHHMSASPHSPIQVTVTPNNTPANFTLRPISSMNGMNGMT